jgi:hypothetical protein
MAAAFLSMATASAIFGGTDLTVRRVVKPGQDGAGTVSLYRPCTSHECGLELLGNVPPRPSEFRGSIGAGRVFRAEVPDGEGWWVVVEAPGRVPMAMLWRPPTGAGDLPVVASPPAGLCSVTVRDERNEPLADATVLPGHARTNQRGTGPTQRPALLGNWRPWTPPVWTNSRGTALLVAPAAANVPFLVGAPGRGYTNGTCAPGDTLDVVLARRTTSTFQIRTERGEPLRGALARSADGWPLGLVDDAGRLELTAAEVEAALSTGGGRAPLWLETAAGELLEPFRRSGEAIFVRSRSRTHFGTVTLASAGATSRSRRLPPHVAEEAHYWREPLWQWSIVDQRVATRLKQSVNGEYAAPLLPGEGIWFAARGHGYAYCDGPTLDVEHRGSLTPAGENVCPALRLARLIDGTVLDHAGNPVSGAELLLDWRQDRTGTAPTIVQGLTFNSPGSGALLLLRSGTDGRFSSDRVAPYAPPTARYKGFVGVRVSKEGYLPVTWGNIQRFASDSGRYHIPLDAGVRITGRVLSRESGLPIPGAEIGIGNFGGRGYVLALGPLEREYGPYGMVVPLTRTGMDGAFALNASTGRWDVLVRAENHTQHQVRGVEIGAAGLDLGDIRLGPGARIEGVVLDGSANPAATARIEVAGVRIERALPRPGAMDRRFNDAAVFETAPDGRFIVGGLHEDSQVNLRISSTGFATRVLEQRSPAATPFLEVVLEPEAVIAGKVTLDGEPAPAGIQLFDQRSSLALRFLGAGDDGTFRFVGLGADRYGLEVTPGQSGVDRWRSTVEVEAGRVAEVAVELETGPPDRTLIGTVAGHGVGLANVEIRVGDFSAVTDGGGEYEIRGLRPGLHNVAAGRGPERPPLMESVRIRDPTTRLDFDFSEGLVEGTAYWSDGPPVAFGSVRFFGGRRRTKVETDGSGRFEVRLEVGEYIASALSPSGAVLASRRVRINDFESELRIVFGRQRITGTILGLTERELGRLRVEALNEQDLRALPARVDSSGRYMIERASGGPWKVVGTVGGGERRASREVFVEEDDVEVDLQFERLFNLTGVVRLDGVPVESTRVVLARELVWSEMRQSWTRDDGGFSFSDLERGEYRVGVGASIRDVRVHGDDHMMIDLASGQVRGSVRDPETLVPRAGAQVLLWPALATQSEATQLGLILRMFTDENGEFAFDRVPEGSWTVDTPEYPGPQSPLSVAPGALTTVSLLNP